MKHLNISTLILTAGLASIGFASPSDTEIQKSAHDSYVFKNYLKDDNINVKANNGVVTLTGTVSEDSHRDLAQETVSDLPKVTKVNNQLKVKSTTYPKMSDGWITTKVKTSLMLHRHVSGLSTDVETKGGVVTLKGTAESDAEKQLATEYAKDIEGVKDVKNEMVVSSSSTMSPVTSTKATGGAAKTEMSKTEKDDPKVDDASITGQIALALFTHKATSALKTEVHTKDGVVTLKGNVKDQKAITEATKISKNIYGVKEVKNEMIVK